MIMSHSLQQSRRPSVSIYEYPEDLNPFKEDELDQVELRKSFIPVNCSTSTTKEHKQKFWTFGKSRIKRPNSFSIKSTWNGIFGKRKDCDRSERKPSITTVSSMYRNTNCIPETVASSRLSTDQQEFDQALWTLTRRRKYTLDNSSRYSSSLTVNSDSRRIYDGSPQETTASIMGDLTPKPPTRRFGQVSSKSTDEIPPLNYYDYRSKDIENGNCDIPVPPKRSGVRSSQRLHAPLDTDENNSSVTSGTMIDENENMTDDYVFKRYNRNPLQKSNLSINSCLSMASVYHSGRKKRRAPPPPIDKDSSQLFQDTKTKSDIHTDSDLNDNRDNIESIDIVKAAEDIKDEMTKRNQSLDDNSSSSMINNSPILLVEMENSDDALLTTTDLKNNSENDDNEVVISGTIDHDIIEDITENLSNTATNDDASLNVELKKEINQCVGIVKDVNLIENKDDKSIKLRKKESLGNASCESFCVKEEIEKIERQIKLLETNKVRSRTCSLSYNNDNNFTNNILLQRSASRRSLQENRRNFFRDLTGTTGTDDRVKIQLKEFPRAQNDIKIVRLNELQVTNAAMTMSIVPPEKPVKVIELHISEPIKQKPEFTVTEMDINPIPKPRRYNALQTDNNQLNTNDSHINKDVDGEQYPDSL